MPLRKGNSQAIISQNIEELEKGNVHRKTQKKKGKKKADKQSVAIALSEARKGMGGF